MKELILQALSDLRRYALAKGVEADIFYQEEESSLMRFANSAISLNTSEHLIRVEITAYQGRKRMSTTLITALDNMDEMRGGIDRAAEMVAHAQPLEYEPTLTVFKESFTDDSVYDGALAEMTNAEKLEYFNQASRGLESDERLLSGIFSSGVNTIAQINTRSEHTQFFRTTDAQIIAVLAHSRLKWEVQAKQSASRKVELNPEALHQELAFLVERYQVESAQQLPLGRYDIVFGPSATAELISLMEWIGFDGGWMKRGYSFLSEDQVDKRVFSDQLTLIDDPYRSETFPLRRDFTGLPRQPFSIIRQGIFQNFIWQQDDADEYAMQPTGHTVSHLSLVMAGGDRQVSSLAELVSQPRAQDLLYIPHLHYMNVPDPSHGVITGSSRYGALLLKKDGSVVLPFNVRLTQSLLEILGEKVAWLSRQTVASNTSSSYGARNPRAVIVPQFMCVRELEISHSNRSF